MPHKKLSSYCSGKALNSGHIGPNPECIHRIKKKKNLVFQYSWLGGGGKGKKYCFTQHLKELLKKRQETNLFPLKY